MSHSLCGMTRRTFGLSLCSLPLSFKLAAEESGPMPWDQPATVARVYLSGSKPAWPKPTLDVQAEVQEIEARLAEVGRKNAHNVRLVGGEVLRTAGEVRPWLAKMGEIDGVLMIPLMQPTPTLQPVVDALQTPGLFFSRPYATHAWASIAGLRKSGRKLDVVASSSYGDLDPYMRMFRTIRHMRKSNVLVGTADASRQRPAADAFLKAYGTTFKFITGSEFRDAFNAVDVRRAQKEADDYARGALRVIEPTSKEIQSALRFYLALQNMLKQEQANALTIDCFGTLAANTLPGYPCIAWSRFNDAGLYGVCEADLSSTMTQMMITSYTRMPGFVSDPVFDESRNEVIHAHCVSATKMQGLDGPSYPYIIRNHLETNEGAALQVLLPAGETITVGRFVGPEKFLVSTAEVTGLPRQRPGLPNADPHACRRRGEVAAELHCRLAPGDLLRRSRAHHRPHGAADGFRSRARDLT